MKVHIVILAVCLQQAVALHKILKMEPLQPAQKVQDEDLASQAPEETKTNYLRVHWTVDQVWDAWKHVYGKKYSSEYEEQRRYKIFVAKYNEVLAHNEKFRRGEVSFDVEMNRFADMSRDEIKAKLNGFNRQLLNASFPLRSRVVYNRHLLGANGDKPLPKAVDWRSSAVTPVKDQGHCGSCWAFSTTGALEGQHYMKTKKLISLSEQNLVDCSGKWGNNGCEGGLMDQAFQYIKDNAGIDTEPSYPYEGIDAKCRFKPQFVGATDNGFVDIPSGDEDALMHAIATIGPVSIAIDASHNGFHDYTTGVYNDPECGNTPDSLDHGVLCVGYGTDEKTGQDFWLVKNSWSTAWGDGGYIRIARNKNNMCGVATMASYPVV